MTPAEWDTVTKQVEAHLGEVKEVAAQVEPARGQDVVVPALFDAWRASLVELEAATATVSDAFARGALSPVVDAALQEFAAAQWRALRCRVALAREFATLQHELMLLRGGR